MPLGTLHEEIQRKAANKDRALIVHKLHDGRTVLQSRSRYSDCNGMGCWNMFDRNDDWLFNFDRMNHSLIKSSRQVKDIDSTKVKASV